MVDCLKQYVLVERTCEYVEIRANDQGLEPRLYKNFIDRMLTAVIEGIWNNRDLRLVRLVGEKDALGIFLENRNVRQYSGRRLAFTSYSKDKGTFIPVKVLHDGTHTVGRTRLYTQSWINGLWFAQRKPKSTYVFPYLLLMITKGWILEFVGSSSHEPRG